MRSRNPQYQLQRLSRLFQILLAAALGLLILFQVCVAVALLFLFHGDGTWHAGASWTATGINLAIVAGPDMAPGVALASLGAGQRALLALLAVTSGACSGLALFHLFRLFTLYTHGVVFAEDNIRHIKHFGLWLVVTAVVVNIAGRVFPLITGEPAGATANAAMALVYGCMTYVIARVMELGRAADEERKEFI